MSGTKSGADLATKTIKSLYGKDFFKRIGALGGSTKTNATHLRGFGSDHELAREVGKIGGTISKRRPNVK